MVVRASRRPERMRGPFVSENAPCPFRMVIQQLGASENPAYRVVVYGDNQPPQHSDFSSAQTLFNALGAAIPDFDQSKLTLSPLAAGQGSMVFVGEINLDKAQLVLLGMK